jgi:hypothetical protein
MGMRVFPLQEWRVSLRYHYELLDSTNFQTFCTVLAVLVGLQTTPLNYSQAFIADFFISDYTVGITIALFSHKPC